MIYEPNTKHKHPWQHGRKGSLCPGPGQLDEAKRDEMLAQSENDPAGSGKRFATDGARAYCAQEHEVGRFHGYPVGWKEVPEQLRRAWLAQKVVSRRDIKRFWDGGAP